ARDLLAQLTRNSSVNSLATGIKRLGESRSPVAVAALLEYLPDAETEALAEHVRAILERIAKNEARPDAALVRGLADALPEKRLAAGVCLARFEEHRPAVRKLLNDPDAEVRHQLALALLAYQEKESLRVLID